MSLGKFGDSPLIPWSWGNFFKILIDMVFISSRPFCILFLQAITTYFLFGLMITKYMSPMMNKETIFTMN
jgi:hypothetical protein